MTACPLCVLGIPQEDHTPEAWIELARNQHWQALVARFNMDNPGIVPSMNEETGE